MVATLVVASGLEAVADLVGALPSAALVSAAEMTGKSSLSSVPSTSSAVAPFESCSDGQVQVTVYVLQHTFAFRFSTGVPAIEVGWR